MFTGVQKKGSSDTLECGRKGIEKGERKLLALFIWLEVSEMQMEYFFSRADFL
jgi:hypothetical protein